MWLSLVERFVRDEEVACSNHVIPTKAQILRFELFYFSYLGFSCNYFPLFIYFIIMMLVSKSIFSL